MKEYKNIIIGSGPSGLMCANKLNNIDTLLLERNSELGGKIKVSGNGRCNVTNNKNIDRIIENIPHNGKFLYPCLNLFGPNEIINFFKNKKINLKEENDNRIFPESNNSKDIIKALTKDLKINILLDYYVDDIVLLDNKFIINNQFITTNLIIATGGKTYQHLGTDGTGYILAEKLNHTITNLFPCEVPILSNDPIISSKIFQGISLPQSTIHIFINNKVKYKLSHDLLITHFGFSGPLALRCSYFINKELLKGNKVDIEIKNDNYPKKIQKYLDDNKLNTLKFNIYDTKQFKTAFVTSGGIQLKDIDPKSYQSKLINNLFFIGEILDFNAFTGGYNITSCLSQGYLCGDYINKKK